LTRQYWTGIGFAVLDVNHRGSTGHGRRYRQSLLGHWGDYDASDIVDGVDYLYHRGLIDRSRVCIRGRSAGGYAVLRALTEFPDYFSAGACYFGIGNLVTLTECTHKFESRYTDRLIGEDFDPERASKEHSAFYRRSPINYLFRARSPMIIFQGLRDKVVPPSVAEEIVAALRANGVVHEYVEYENEGHGFRSSDTNVDALTRETAFYARVLELQ
jgi:dipeptidyl aminopeptidase/acylaminoacyl peptidase